MFFNNEKFSIIGIEGPELFIPEDFGMNPETMGTFCYRGFFAAYEISEDQLYIKKLTIQTHDGRYKTLGGIRPIIHMNKDSAKEMKKIRGAFKKRYEENSDSKTVIEAFNLKMESE